MRDITFGDGLFICVVAVVIITIATLHALVKVKQEQVKFEKWKATDSIETSQQD